MTDAEKAAAIGQCMDEVKDILLRYGCVIRTIVNYTSIDGGEPKVSGTGWAVDEAEEGSIAKSHAAKLAGFPDEYAGDPE